MQMKKASAALLGVFILAGCTFAGDPEANYSSVPGFLFGIWHGAVFWWALILCIFTKVQITTSYNTGWPYYLGFAIGVFGLSWEVGLAMGLLSFLYYLF